jgi:anti-sigma factor RsiW
MNQHVIEWLGAYLDGELTGLRLRQVESHLAECATCQAELEELRRLAALLQESPVPEGLASPERFVAQVGLRLPRRPERPAWQRALERGWQLLPVGLLGAWVFAEVVFGVSKLVLAALQLGLGGDTVAGWLHASEHSAWLAEIFRFLGVGVSGVSYAMLQWLSASGQRITLNLAVAIVFSLLYWSWLASWWARRQRGQA